ncbi:MAG TPA: SH3 domain-containing protein [Flavobacteriales bacterium]|nr:SH3 domain-containing protein [Flavobacteriales bacterium]
MRRWIYALFLSPVLCSAQNELHVQFGARSDYLIPDEAPPEYTLTGTVVLRSDPSHNSYKVAALYPGTPVYIDSVSTDTVVANGVRSVWYRVEANNQIGWVWGGLLAQDATGSHADPTVKFLGGLEYVASWSDTTTVRHKYRLVAVREGKQLDAITLPSFAWNFGQLTAVGNRGLQNVDDVLFLDVPCVGGCGCTTGSIVVFWSGGRFHHVANMMGSPDGAYSTDQSLVFPCEMDGVPGVIKRVTSSYDESDLPGGEQLAADGDEQPKEFVRRFVTTEFLRWDGAQLVPSVKAKEERSYLLPTN